MPKFIVVGDKEAEVSNDFIKELVTTDLSNNPYWMHNSMLSKEEVSQFLNGNVSDPVLLNRIAYYTLFFSENIVFSTCLLIKANEGEKDMMEHAELHKPVLQEIRSLYEKAVDSTENKTEIIRKMISVGRVYAIDPL